MKTTGKIVAAVAVLGVSALAIMAVAKADGSNAGASGGAELRELSKSEKTVSAPMEDTADINNQYWWPNRLDLSPLRTNAAK